MYKVTHLINYIKHVIRQLMCDAKSIHHIMQDEAFVEQQGWGNLYACCFVSVLLCIINLTGFFGTYSPDAAGAVLPNVNATTVYLTIFCINAVFFYVFYWILHHRKTYCRKWNYFVYLFLFIDSSTACLTFFTTQDGSSFFFEYLLQLTLVYLLPVYDNLKLLCTVAAINLITTFGVIAVTGHQIAWQDRYDIVLFYLICLVIIMFRRHLTFSFGRTRMNLQASNEEFYQRSRTDEVTGLLNREALREDFGHYIGREVNVMICDIDKFKFFNDTYGHEMGDHVLAVVSSLFREHFDAAHVYRYGGDEFLLISFAPPDEFQVQVDAFRMQLHDTLFTAIRRQPTISGGCTWGLCESAVDLRKMFAHADYLLYQAKAVGRNRVCYEIFDKKKAEASLHQIQNMWDKSS